MTPNVAAPSVAPGPDSADRRARPPVAAPAPLVAHGSLSAYPHPHMASGSLRRRQIEELHHAALTCEAADRAALLARADPDVRREVELLLAQKAGGVALSGSVTEPPALVSLDENQVRAGTQFGPYRVESVLGAGGMGRVYRALDTRLNRSVAFKIVRDEFGERFAREARAIARLNHPHICTCTTLDPTTLSWSWSTAKQSRRVWPGGDCLLIRRFATPCRWPTPSPPHTPRKSFIAI